MENKLPQSICKYIRFEKARIRREVSSEGGRKTLIDELYERLLKGHEKLFVKKSEKGEAGVPDAK